MHTALEYRHVQFGYDNLPLLLHDLSLSIHSGEFVAVIGRNGSGKTTLTRLAMGLLRPKGGKILVQEQETEGLATGEIAHMIGYVFQNPDRQLFLDTTEKEIAFGPENQGLHGQELQDAVNEALAKTGLEPYRHAYPRTLSKGIKQRIALASVLAMHPAILILDEPTSGQDAVEAREFMNIVSAEHQQGTTVILVSHDMEMIARLAQRCILIGDGGIVLDGSPAAIFQQTNLLHQYGITPPLAARLTLAVNTPEFPYTVSLPDLLRRLHSVGKKGDDLFA